MRHALPPEANACAPSASPPTPSVLAAPPTSPTVDEDDEEYEDDAPVKTEQKQENDTSVDSEMCDAVSIIETQLSAMKQALSRGDSFDSMMREIDIMDKSQHIAAETEDMDDVMYALDHAIRTATAEMKGAPLPEQNPDMTPREAALAAALGTNGQFDMQRGSVAVLWRTEMRRNEELNAEYKAARGDFAKQRALKHKWATMKMNEETRKKVRITSSIKIDESKGTFRPLEIIFKKEGGSRAALMATKNIALTCISLGEEFIHLNSFSKRTEFFHPQKSLGRQTCLFNFFLSCYYASLLGGLGRFSMSFFS